jgi:hypothetical protein
VCHGGRDQVQWRLEYPAKRSAFHLSFRGDA